MRVSGNFKEIRFLFQRAADSNAEMIHFSPNGDVWMLYKLETYVYIRSQLAIDESVFFTKIAIKNMHKLLNRAYVLRKEERKKGGDIALEYVDIGKEYIRYDRDDHHRYSVLTNMEQSELLSDLAHRLKSLSNSYVELDKPYIRLEKELIKQFFKEVRSRGIGSRDYPNEDYKFDPTDDEFKNQMRMNGYEFEIVRTTDSGEVQLYAFDDHFFVPRFYHKILIHLSDSDLRFMSRIGHIYGTEEFYVIPFSTHYVVESHSNGVMTFKMSMPRIKRIELGELL